MRLARLFLLLLTLTAPAGAAEEALLAVLADGEPFRARLTAVEPDWKLRFGEGAAARTLAAADLVMWGVPLEPQQGSEVVLAGGGLLVAESVQIADERLNIVSATVGKASLPLELISGIVLRPPSDRALHDQLLARLASPGGETDRVLLDNGDELTGTIAGMTTDPTGAHTLTLKTEAGGAETSIAGERLVAIVFNPTLVDKPRASGLRALVGLRDGSSLTVLAMSTDAAMTKLTLAGGIELHTATTAIAALQPLDGRVVYLSDLQPASYRHIPYLQLAWPYHADRSATGAALRAGGQRAWKGLGMHSPARITYDLDQSYRRFAAELAVDDETGGGGSVVFRVFIDDGSGNWTEKAASETVRGGQKPITISADLSGAKRISLLVDYSDRGDELDHADWLNARLIR